MTAIACALWTLLFLVGDTSVGLILQCQPWTAMNGWWIRFEHRNTLLFSVSLWPFRVFLPGAAVMWNAPKTSRLRVVVMRFLRLLLRRWWGLIYRRCAWKKTLQHDKTRFGGFFLIWKNINLNISMVLAKSAAEGLNISCNRYTVYLYSIHVGC